MCSFSIEFITGKFATKIYELTEDIRIRLSTYKELAVLFIKDKFNLDLSNEEEKKKFRTCLVVVVLLGVLAFLYGKNMLSSKKNGETESDVDKNNSMKNILEKIAPTVYTTLITLLISKKLLKVDENGEVIEAVTLFLNFHKIFRGDNICQF